MKNTVRLVGLVLVGGLLQGCAMHNSDPGEMISAAKQIDQQVAGAFSSGDVDGVMAPYWNSPDLVVFPPGELEAAGYDNVRQAISKAMKEMPGAKLELTEAHYLPEGPAVVGWGLWAMSTPETRNSGHELQGRYTEVIEKKNGKWVIVLDHISAPLPPPAQEAK